MGYHSLQARILAVTCFIAAGYVISKAIQLWNKQVDLEVHGEVKDLHKFIPDNYNKFKETGSVQNRTHHPDTKKVNDTVAKEAAAILKGGYITFRKPAGKKSDRQQVHLYYTSLHQAVKNEPRLQAILQDYGVDEKYLLRRMHEVDPDLVYRTVDWKLELSIAQMAERKLVSLQLLNYCWTIPNFLASIFWIDEVSIWFVDKHATTHVYADAHDQGVHAVIHLKHLKSGQQIKVRCLAAVNALLGPCFLEFTTGTTEIKRLWNRRTEPYKVSYGGGAPQAPESGPTPHLGFKLGVSTMAGHTHLHACLIHNNCWSNGYAYVSVPTKVALGAPCSLNPWGLVFSYKDEAFCAIHEVDAHGIITQQF